MEKNIIIVIIILIIIIFIAADYQNQRYYCTDVILRLPGKQILIINKNNLPYPPERVWKDILSTECFEYFLLYNAGP